MRRELVEAARRLADMLSHSGVDIGKILEEYRVSIERGEACELLERLSPLVRNYSAIEEGSLQPSAAYLALEPVARLLERICRGASVDEELVALALAIIGLLEKGMVARASSLAAVIEARLGSRPSP